MPVRNEGAHEGLVYLKEHAWRNLHVCNGFLGNPAL
eukprot:SAG22_NODE_5422_length_1016_cov_2.234460_1_plen_35_part_10